MSSSDEEHVGTGRSVGVVIPAYNPDPEELVAYVDSLRTQLDPVTIRIELDAPEAALTDRLNDDLDAALTDGPVTVNTVSHRRGKGAAITNGFEQLDTDILAFADADGATPAIHLARIIDVVATDSADIAVGSRRHPDSTVHTHQTIARRYMGDLFAWLSRKLLGVSLYDYQCGAKALSVEGWNEVRDELRETGFAWDIELVAMAAAFDLRIAEVPIEWYDRAGSTVSPLRTPVDLLRALFVVRHRSKRLDGNRMHGVIASAIQESPILRDR